MSFRKVLEKALAEEWARYEEFKDAYRPRCFRKAKITKICNKCKWKDECAIRIKE